MAVPVIAATSTASGAPTAAAAVPAGSTSGSLVIAWFATIHNGGSGGSYGCTPPTGWTVAASTQREIDTDIQLVTGWAYKRLTAADSGTYTFTQTGGNLWGISVIVARVTGARDTGSPFETLAVGTNAAPSVVAAFTPAGDERLALVGTWSYAAAATTPSGWTPNGSFVDINSNTNVVYARQADATTTGPTSFSGGVEMATHLATLVPAASAPAPVSRTATASLSLNATATATAMLSRTASAGLTLSASATAEPVAQVQQRTASASLSMAASATARQLMSRTATASLALSASASGRKVGDTWGAWKTAVAQIPTRTAKMLWIGDSLLEGGGVSNRLDRIIDKTLAKTRARYAAQGSGAGYLPPFYSEWAVTPDPATTNGTLTHDYGQGARAVVLANQYVQWAGLPMTSFDIVYRGGGGQLTVTVDGTQVGTINTAASTGGGRIQRFSNVTAGQRTVRVTGTGIVEGIVVYNGDEAGGVMQWDSAHIGYASNDYGPEQIAGWNNYAPDLVIYDLMGNNFFEGGPVPTQCAADFKNYVAALTGTPTIVVLVAPRSNGLSGTVNGYTFEDYANAMKSAAAEVGAAVFDGTDELPGVDWDAQGLMSDDTHPNAAGYELLATAMDQFLAEGVGIPTETRTAVATISLQASGTRTVRYSRTATASLPLTASAVGRIPALPSLITGKVAGIEIPVSLVLRLGGVERAVSLAVKIDGEMREL